MVREGQKVEELGIGKSGCEVSNMLYNSVIVRFLATITFSCLSKLMKKQTTGKSSGNKVIYFHEQLYCVRINQRKR